MLEVNLGERKGKDKVSQPNLGFGSRLCEGKVLAPLRIRSTLRDPRTIERKMVAKNHCSNKHLHRLKETQDYRQD